MRASLIAALLLTGCGPLMPVLEPVGPPIQPGTYQVCMSVELLPTPEQVALRCNHGIPGGNALGCVFSRANPPILVAPVQRDVNDWRAKSILGHEVTNLIPGGRYAQ